MIIQLSFWYIVIAACIFLILVNAIEHVSFLLYEFIKGKFKTSIGDLSAWIYRPILWICMFIAYRKIMLYKHYKEFLQEMEQERKDFIDKYYKEAAADS